MADAEVTDKVTAKEAAVSGGRHGTISRAALLRKARTARPLLPAKMVPATKVPVYMFREIMLWQLAIDRRELAAADDAERLSMPEIVAATAQALVAEFHARKDDKAPAVNSLWEPLQDPLFDLPHAMDYAATYGNFVYFHEFAQRLLFERWNWKSAEAMPPIVSFRNRALTGMKVKWQIDKQERELLFKVERCDLTLVQSGLAFLALEVKHVPGETDPQVTLADVQDLVDYMRRAFIPYFYMDDQKKILPGKVLKEVSWLCGEEVTGGPHVPGALVNELGHIYHTRKAPVLTHWRDLLPLPLAGQDGRRGAVVPQALIDRTRWRWRAFADERMPVMVSVELPEYWPVRPEKNQTGTPQQPEDSTAEEREKRLVAARRPLLEVLERGDLVRLCFCDNRGSGLPYAEGFLKTFEADNCYERFRHWGTLYMVTDYSFVQVGAGGFPDMYMHIRTMYFHMFLLAHLELASHIALSNRLSVAIETRDRRRRERDEQRADRAFREDVLEAQRDFQEIELRFRFTGVSHQMQGGELFDLMRRRMHLDDIYTELKNELDSATDYLLSVNGDRQTDAASRLNVVATIGVVLSLGFSALGMNTFLNGDFWKHGGSENPLLTALRLTLAPVFSALGMTPFLNDDVWKQGEDENPFFTWWGSTLAVGGVFFVLAGLALVTIHRLFDKRARRQSHTFGVLRWWLGGLTAVAVVAGGYGCWMTLPHR